jgi:hypothetical protein
MAAAQVFGYLAGHTVLSNFQVSALYVLARQRVCQATRDQALRLAEAGELITKSRAEALVAAQRGTPDPDPRNRHIANLQRYVANKTHVLSHDQKVGFAEELRRLADVLSDSRAVPLQPAARGGITEPASSRPVLR